MDKYYTVLLILISVWIGYKLGLYDGWKLGMRDLVNHLKEKNKGNRGNNDNIRD